MKWVPEVEVTTEHLAELLESSHLPVAWVATDRNVLHVRAGALRVHVAPCPAAAVIQISARIPSPPCASIALEEAAMAAANDLPGVGRACRSESGGLVARADVPCHGGLVIAHLIAAMFDIVARAVCGREMLASAARKGADSGVSA